LNVSVKKNEVEKLKKAPGPVYVVGIDVHSERGFIKAITASTPGMISGLSIRHPLKCLTLRSLWDEVDTYWNTRRMLLPGSQFGI
jgi:hypothetical protein